MIDSNVSSAPNEQPHVLVVDDEPGILEMVSLCLRQSGYRISTAKSAEEALKLFEAETLHAVISDVMMPGEDGISLLGKMHDRKPELPVIIMTGYAQLQIAVNAIKNGAFDFIHKPFDFGYLRKVVEKAVKYSELLQRDKEYRAELEETVALRTAELTNALHQLDEINAALHKSSQKKNEFMSTVSHEMRTPMNGVIGGLELLATTDLSGEQCEFLALARQAADNMIELVDSMLMFAAQTSNETSSNHSSFAVRPFFESIFTSHTAVMSSKGLSSELLLQPELPEHVCCDEEKISKLLDILLNNAVKFTESGWIKLDCALDCKQGAGSLLVMKVSDSGVGIPEDKHESIFEAFSQADGSYSRSYNGMGLGLSIAKNIVEQLQGTITVESSVRNGSCFTCMIPCDIPSKGDVS